MCRPCLEGFWTDARGMNREMWGKFDVEVLSIVEIFRVCAKPFRGSAGFRVSMVGLNAGSKSPGTVLLPFLSKTMLFVLSLSFDL